MFSSRVPSDRTVNRITATIAALRAAGAPYVDLTESNPTKVGIEYPDTLIAELGHPRSLDHRPSPFGLMEARQAVVADLARRGLDVPAERVVLATSTSEAYGVLFKLLCDPGDSVLVPRPSYPLFDHLTKLEGVTATHYELSYEGRWRVDLKSLERGVSSRTKAVLVVNPNNPTGSFLTQDEIKSLAELCRLRSLALIGDEVFADYSWTGASPASVVAQDAALTFSLGGLSKAVGLPQLKLGWIAASGPPELVGEALERMEIICDAFLSVATPVQLGLPELLKEGVFVRDQIRKRIGENLRQLEDAIRRHPSCQQLRADGGWYAVVKVPATASEEALVIDLLERDRVLVHPGYFFDFPSEGFIVVSLLPRVAAFGRGIEAVLRRLGAA
jgi:aspartate/methionine/tyrosine aminotransferase